MERSNDVGASDEAVHRKPHVSLLHYLESGVERLFGRSRREKRSLRNEVEEPPSPSLRKKSASLLSRGESNLGRLVPDKSTSSSSSSSSDNHKIRHARKKLDAKGLEGVLQILFDTNSIKEPSSSNSNHNQQQQQQPPFDSDMAMGGFAVHHRRREEVPEDDFASWKIQGKIMDEDSKVPKVLETNNINDNNNGDGGGRKERNFDTKVNLGGDEYLEYMVEVEPVTPSTIVMAATAATTLAEKSSQGLEYSFDTTNSRLNYSSSQGLSEMRPTTTSNDGEQRMKKSTAAVLKENLDVCYKTDDVLVVIAITCCLNFTFVLLIWACVRWFSVLGSKDLKEFHHLDCEGGGDSTIFPHESVDNYWVPGTHRSRRNRVKGQTSRLTSTSLYTFRPDTVPQYRLRKSYSYSMEDLHFSHT